MRKVVAYELLSLDGVAENPDGFLTEWDDAMDANLAAVIAAQDAVILGRRSYDEWAEFWPGSEIQPFATFINGVRSTSRHLHRSTGVGQCDCHRRRAGRIRSGPEGSPRRRHRRPRQYLCRPTLLAADVIDELRLVIAPTIAGSGRRLLHGLPSIRLESIRARPHLVAISLSTTASYGRHRGVARGLSGHRGMQEPTPSAANPAPSMTRSALVSRGLAYRAVDR